MADCGAEGNAKLVAKRKAPPTDPFKAQLRELLKNYDALKQNKSSMPRANVPKAKANTRQKFQCVRKPKAKANITIRRNKSSSSGKANRLSIRTGFLGKKNSPKSTTTSSPLSRFPLVSRVSRDALGKDLGEDAVPGLCDPSTYLHALFDQCFDRMSGDEIRAARWLVERLPVWTYMSVCAGTDGAVLVQEALQRGFERRRCGML